MPYQKIVLRPGINTQPTQLQNEGGWSLSNLIRWRNGLLEKIGGWVHLISTACIGTVRGLHAWSDLSDISYLAIGSDQRLQILSGGSISDITPFRRFGSLSNAFSTVINTNVVTVHDVSNGVNVDDWVFYSIEVAVGGLIIHNFYKVVTVIDSDNYTITASSNATSTVNNGGSTPFFTTTIGLSTVNVNIPANSYAIGDNFFIHVSTAVGGLTLVGNYLVLAIVDADNFTIDGGSAAISTGSAHENANNAHAHYLLASGLASDQFLVGWGAGGWGLGVWGSSSASQAINPLRNWFLDNFGQILLAMPTNGALYAWTPPVAFENVATVVATAPTMGAGMFVTMPAAQVVVLGAEVSGSQDFLLIRWSDVGSYTNFTATVTNQAGSYRLSRGSKIIGGFQAPQVALIWTDTDLWSMTYTGLPFIYGFVIVGANCGLIAPKAMAQLGNSIFWMSLKGFFQYSGQGVVPLPCTVWDKVFQNLDTANLDKCFAGADSSFNEVFFFYPSLSGGTGEIDSYVKYNMTVGPEAGWDYGSLIRTAWIDINAFGEPIGVDGNKILQQHEMGYDNNGAAMTGVFAESGYVDIAQGTEFIYVDQIIPDIMFLGTDQQVSFTVYGTDYPGGTVRTYGPYSVTSSTKFLTTNIRARQLAFKIQSDVDNVWWRFGAVRYRGAPAGRL